MNKEQLNQIIEELYIEAKKAKEENEIPVACCLLLSDGKKYFTHNKVEANNNPFNHAEFIALSEAQKDTGLRYFKNSTLIVTLEPCLCCMGALIKMGVSSLYYILPDEKGGALSHYHAFVDDKIQINEIEDTRFLSLMNEFFNNLRQTLKES